MNIVPFLSTVILISTLATLILAVASYVAFRLRDRRKPYGVAKKTATANDKTFFVRYLPPGATPAGPADAGTA